MATSADRPGELEKKTAKRRPAKKKAAAKRSTAPERVEGNRVTEVAAELERPSPARKAGREAAPSVTAVKATVTARVVRGVRERDIVAFLRQLIMLLDAGTPLLKSLNSLAQRGDHQGVRNMVAGIAEYVEAGNPLWQAFAREDRYFPPVFVNMIKAAEASGNLTIILKRLADYRERRYLLQKRVQQAMIYPVILLAACLGVIWVIARFVIPSFKEIFATFEIQFNTLTRTVIGTADFIASYWWVGVLIVVGVVALYRGWWVRNPLRRMMSDRIKLRIPISGGIARRTAIADFARTFSLLLRSGLSMMVTLDLCRNAIGNRAYVDVMQDMRDSVERGEGLEKPMRAAERRRLFPAVVVDMLITGEDSGKIDEIADQIADTYEEEVEIALGSLGETLIPVVVVFLGGIVILVALALFMPLVEMIQQVASAGI